MKNCLTIDPEAQWIKSLPVERLIATMLGLMRFQSRYNFFLASPVMRIMSALAILKPRYWIKCSQSDFENLLFSIGVDCQVDATRDHSWNAMEEFFQLVCHRAFTSSNGADEQEGSDVENQMDIDNHPSDLRTVVSFLWRAALECAKRAETLIPWAAKAFETTAKMLRYFVAQLC